MVRPTPETLLEASAGAKTYAVFSARKIYAVFYQERPVNVCTLKGKRYCRVAFANPGHARNLAKKMNVLFDTTDFTVFELTGTREIS